MTNHAGCADIVDNSAKLRWSQDKGWECDVAATIRWIAGGTKPAYYRTKDERMPTLSIRTHPTICVR